MALVELTHVSKSFSKGDETITPLDDVSLQIREGGVCVTDGAERNGKEYAAEPGKRN